MKILHLSHFGQLHGYDVTTDKIEFYTNKRRRSEDSVRLRCGKRIPKQ